MKGGDGMCESHRVVVVGRQWVRVYGRGIDTVGRGFEEDPKIESMEGSLFVCQSGIMMYHTRPTHDFEGTKLCTRPTGMHITTLQLFSRSPTKSMPETSSLQSSPEPGILSTPSSPSSLSPQVFIIGLECSGGATCA